MPDRIYPYDQISRELISSFNSTFFGNTVCGENSFFMHGSAPMTSIIVSGGKCIIDGFLWETDEETRIPVEEGEFGYVFIVMTLVADQPSFRITTAPNEDETRRIRIAYYEKSNGIIRISDRRRMLVPHKSNQIAHGRVSVSPATEQTVSKNVTFPDNAFFQTPIVCATVEAESPEAVVGISIFNVTNTGFTLKVTFPPNQQDGVWVHWIATTAG